MSLRDELMRGDFRSLYLGWLASVMDQELDEDDDLREPPVPPGLAKLTDEQRTLAKFLRIDNVIIDVAAEGSTGEPPAGPSPEDMKQWLKGLSTDEKESYLLLFLTEEGALPARAEMLRRFRKQTASKGSRPMPKIARRRVAKLLADRDALVVARDRKAAERAVKEKLRKEKAEAEARSK